jgi:oligopeptide/dipeptide ABC transporter ATP-binding protein
MTLLEVRGLSVAFGTADGVVKAVRGVSFDIAPGETLGIVGESGSGKSVTCMSMVGLTRGADVAGSVLFEGRDLLQMPAEELRRIRGAEIAMVFQDPLSSLHPYYRIGWQISEAIRAHERVKRSEARRRAIELLGLVGIPEPARRVDDYPHQFSGGMRQRAMIALALSLQPKLLVADEPTTALDVTVQAQILELLKRVQDELNMALILITHDLGIVAGTADRVAVMYAGRIMETADRHALFRQPSHPYTKGLLQALPHRSLHGRVRLLPVPGQPPSLIGLPDGCKFAPRCPVAFQRCFEDEPDLMVTAAGSVGHRAACWLVEHDAAGAAAR